MDIKNKYFKKNYEKGLWSMESITLIYMLFTTILILSLIHI